MSQLNVDPQEIAKFEAFAAIWWDQHSEFRPLHMINPLRLNWIDEHSSWHHWQESTRRRLWWRYFGRKAWHVVALKYLGIDMGAALFNVARLHAEQENVQNIEYRQVPVEQLAEEQAGQYDVVTCMEMLEHVPDPASIILACQKLVKPGGHVFFSTINRNPKAYLFAIIGAGIRFTHVGERHTRLFKSSLNRLSWLTIFVNAELQTQRYDWSTLQPDHQTLSGSTQCGCELHGYIP